MTPGPFRVLMERRDGTKVADLAGVSREDAERHAAYLQRHLPGNPGVIAVEIEEAGWQ